MAELTYGVHVCDGVPRARPERLPDGGVIVSSPLASTLIIGEREAVLVDPPFTREQTQQVGDWVERSGKRLAYIYATHGHGDHWFGTGQLLERFPEGRRAPRAAWKTGWWAYRKGQYDRTTKIFESSANSESPPA